MFGILMSAVGATLGFLLRSLLVKFVVFFALFFVTTGFMAYLSSLLPSTSSINGTLGQIFEAPNPRYVFTYKGNRVIQVSTAAWYKALKRAGIFDFRWHDLRHTWASWHVQNGTPLFALQELGGWESADMVRKYAHLSASHLAVYADKLAALKVADCLEKNAACSRLKID